MPCDYSKYPNNWKTEIRPQILKRALNCCESCGIVNYTVVKKYRSGIRQIIDRFFTPADANNTVKDLNLKANTELYKYFVVVLTVAHLDHDTQNNEFSNLRALCQKCHLGHDKEFHLQNRKINKSQSKPKPK